MEHVSVRSASGGAHGSLRTCFSCADSTCFWCPSPLVFFSSRSHHNGLFARRTCSKLWVSVPDAISGGNGAHDVRHSAYQGPWVRAALCTAVSART